MLLEEQLGAWLVWPQDEGCFERRKKCYVRAATWMNNRTGSSISSAFPRTLLGTSAHVPPLVVQTEVRFPLSRGWAVLISAVVALQYLQKQLVGCSSWRAQLWPPKPNALDLFWLWELSLVCFLDWDLQGKADNGLAYMADLPGCGEEACPGDRLFLRSVVYPSSLWMWRCQNRCVT